MVMSPRSYYIYCESCGWEHYQRTLGCEPMPADIERSERQSFKGNACPKCGNADLQFKPANGLKGKIQGWLWDLK